jgi:uncharacterized protein YjdB
VVTPSSLSFNATGSANAQSFTVSEANYSGAFTATIDNANVASVTQQDATTFVVTPLAAGTATITVTGATGQQQTVSVTVTPLTGQIQ